MELRVLIVSLLCVVHALEALPSERIVDHSQGEKIDDEADRQSTETIRDKRSLGLLLLGLAQIFGYTVTPVQLASLPNPNTTTPAAMSNSSMMMMGMMPNKPQAAASRPANATMPRRQETIRFTGVLNFGNNSDIIGHLQRYEQIFHGRGNNTTMMSTTSPMPMPPMPMPPAKFSVDIRSNEEKPPLLAPFFVKIPLPIAPDLLPATMPIEDLPLSYPAPAISLVSVPDEDAETPVAPSPPQGPPVRKKPVHKEEEMIYRSNGDTERYMIQEKEIYDEKDVRKPNSKYNHQLYIDEPKWKQQQEEKYNELQRNQEERVERLKEKEVERNRDKNVHYNEDKMNEKYKNREEEIDNRNREHASKYESEEEEEPAYSDEKESENSAEEYEEHDEGHASRPSGSSKQSSREDERERAEDYANYDDDDSEPNKQPHGHKQSENFDKYIAVGYNQQLPIGDYFHKNNPEVIRDSYGEVLDNKKLEEDKLADYVNMFKHPYFDTQNIHNPEDTSREGEKATPVSGYDGHLVRIQKLREEYGSPENKYEEYVIEGENDANNDDEESDKENDDARSEKSQDEIDFVKYVPLVVPVRYVDVNDKTQQATTRQLNYKQSDKVTNNELVDDNVSVPTRSKLTPKAGLPERPRQLHDGEIDKQLQLWPPPFDYAFDTTEPVNTIVPPYPPNYYQPVVKTVVTNDVKNDNSVKQPSGYLVVVGDPNHQYPHNVYYFPNEAVDLQNRELYLNIEHAQNQVYIPQQSVNQQTNPNLTKQSHNLNERSSQNYYHQSQEVPVNVLDRYEYISGYTPRAEESSNIGVRGQVIDINNWSNKIHQARGDTDEQNVASSNQNAQRIPSERPRDIQLPRRRRSSQQDDQGKNEDKKEETTSRQLIPENKPFDDPESAHDFFGFNKDDYSFEGESSDASEVEEDGKTATELTTVPEPITYRHDDESMMSDELENDPGKAEVTEYRNKVATLKVSEQRQLELNGPIQYVNYIRNI